MATIHLERRHPHISEVVVRDLGRTRRYRRTSTLRLDPPRCSRAGRFGSGASAPSGRCSIGTDQACRGVDRRLHVATGDRRGPASLSGTVGSLQAGNAGADCGSLNRSGRQVRRVAPVRRARKGCRSGGPVGPRRPAGGTGPQGLQAPVRQARRDATQRPTRSTWCCASRAACVPMSLSCARVRLGRTTEEQNAWCRPPQACGCQPVEPTGERVRPRGAIDRT